MESKNKLKRGLSTDTYALWHWVQQLAPGCFTVRRCHQNGRSKRVVGLYYRWYAAYIIMRALGEMSVHNPAASLSRVMRRKTSARWQVTLPADLLL